MERHKKISSKKSIKKETTEEKKSGWEEFMDIIKIWL